MSLFDPKCIDTLIQEEAQKLQFKSVSNVRPIRINDKAKNVLKQLEDKFSPNAMIEFVSEGQFDVHQLLETMLCYTGRAKVYFSTYAIKEFQARQLFRYKEDYWVEEYFALLDTRINKQDAKVFQFINQFMNVAQTSIHAKILVAVGEEKNVCAITSANFTKNYRIEAGVISCMESSALFYSEFIKKHFENE